MMKGEVVESAGPMADIKREIELLRKVLPNGGKLSDAELAAGAAYAKATGLNPVRGEFYIVPGVGVAPGYKGELARRGVNLRTQYRMLTPEEREFHDVAAGDKAVICQVAPEDEVRAAQLAGLEPAWVEGLGIVRKEEQWVSYKWATAQSGKRYRKPLPEAEWKERAAPPVGRSWGWVARNRALKDALNHLSVPGFRPPDERPRVMVEEARAEGLPVPDIPDDAVLTLEQASAIVEQARARAALTEQDRESARADHRRAQYQRAMGLLDEGEPCPDCGQPLPYHAPECEWHEFSPSQPDTSTTTATGDAEVSYVPVEPSALDLLRNKLEEIRLSVPGRDDPPTKKALDLCRGALHCLAKRRAEQLAELLYGPMAGWDHGEVVAVTRWIDARKEEAGWVPSAEAVEDLKSISHMLDPQPALFEVP